MGRGPRGGRAPGARDVAGARGAHAAAIGDAKTCPHGHPLEPATRAEGVPLADVEDGAKVTILRFENEAEDLLHYLKDAGVEPGSDGTVSAIDSDQVTITSTSAAGTGPRGPHLSATERAEGCAECPPKSIVT